jgi:hypothetical protein
MSHRFSHSQLYALRNHIPIRYVIESLLRIPSGMVEGVFRFRCPLCAGHHTAIQSDTNLSRCFQCAKNFNAIDLCMLVRRTNFVESVQFLIEHQNRSAIQESRSARENLVNLSEPPREVLKDPVALKDILPKLIGKCFEGGLNNHPHKTAPQDIPSMDHIAELEYIVHVLSQIINRLKSCFHLR